VNDFELNCSCFLFPWAKTIYRTWKKPFANISEELRQRIDHCKKKNKGWKSVYYDDEQMHRFFRETRKDLEPLYNALPAIVAKADLFRYAVIHTYGGVYLDSDIRCKLPFDEMFNVSRFLKESAKLLQKERMDKEEEKRTIASSPPEGTSQPLISTLLFSFLLLFMIALAGSEEIKPQQSQRTREESKEEPRQAIPLLVCFTNKTHPQCSDQGSLVSIIGPNLISALWLS